MEDFDPVGGGFLVERIADFFSGSFGSGSGGGDGSGILGIIAGFVTFFKVVFILFFIAFIVGIIYVVYQLSYFRPQLKVTYASGDSDKRKVGRARWDEIMRKFKSGTESDFRLAVIEADSLVDEMFKRMGFEGESLGERIASVTAQEVPSIADLSAAHALRNKLVHSPGYQISREEGERSIRAYQKVLEELEVI